MHFLKIAISLPFSIKNGQYFRGVWTYCAFDRRATIIGSKTYEWICKEPIASGYRWISFLFYLYSKKNHKIDFFYRSERRQLTSTNGELGWRVWTRRSSISRDIEGKSRWLTGNIINHISLVASLISLHPAWIKWENQGYPQITTVPYFHWSISWFWVVCTALSLLNLNSGLC